jgi:3-oxoacyl-[acyl-carrier-protein] synthase III
MIETQGDLDPYHSFIDPAYSFSQYDHGAKLLPVVGTSRSGERFENEHFHLSRQQLRSLKNSSGGRQYSQWLVDRIWPQWKHSCDNFKKFDKQKFSDIGIGSREYNNLTHVALGLAAIEDLFCQIDQKQLMLLSPNKTGVVLCTSTIVSARAQGTLKTDHLEQNTVLNSIASTLGLSPLFCVNEVCSGFVAALMQCQTYLEGQNHIDSIVIVTSEKMSDVMDYTDPATSILFGDLTAAMTITKQQAAGLKLLGGAKSYYTCYPGKGKEVVSKSDDKEQILYFDDGSKTKGKPVMRMNGRATYEQAMTHVPRAITFIAEYLGVKNIDQILCHQANKKILVGLAEKIREEGFAAKAVVPISMERGNLSSSSIPNLVSSMLNQPEKVVSQLNKVGLYPHLTDDSLQWRKGSTIALVSIGIGIYMRSMVLVYE